MWRLLRRLLGVAAFAVVFRACVCEPVRISDDSMTPALVEGDVVFVSKIRYGLRIPGPGSVPWEWSRIRRGDLVMAAGVGNPPVTVVRRVEAVPGERVREITLAHDQYLLTMDHESSAEGTVVPRRAVVGKVTHIWLPSGARVESGKPGKFLQKI
ncbi:MAG: signal peptidase I [Bdellovibrionales bacterium]|nr:signal peptidase I [Bdellovibrionales bacterium]